MTQSQLRWRTGIYALVLVMLNFVMVIYAREGILQRTQYHFDREMIARVMYVKKMAEWIPLAQLNTTRVLSPISDSSAFSVGVAPASDSDIGKVRLSEGFPVTASVYSSKLECMITVTEGEITRANTGCPEEFMCVGICFVGLLWWTIFASLGAANLLARAKHTRIARCVIWLGYLFIPVAFSIIMQTMIVFIHERGSDNAWEDDVQRSAVLFTSMFSVMHTQLPTLTAEILAEAMEEVNERLGLGHLYQVSIAVGKERAVTPPLYSEEVQNIIFGDASKDEIPASGFTDSHYLFATSSLPTVSSLLVVLRHEDDASSVVDKEYLPALLTMLVGTVVFGLIWILVLLPLKFLGHLGAPPAGASPWESRLPRYWPFLKLMEGFFLVAATIAVLMLAFTRISKHFQRTDALQDYYLVRTAKIRRVQTISHMLGVCYTGLLKGNDWNAAYLDYTSVGLDAKQELSVYLFYYELTALLQSQKYYLYSASAELATELQKNWPLLALDSKVRLFLDHADKSIQEDRFKHWIMRFDNEFLLSILINNVQFLEEGSSTIVESMKNALTDLDTTELTADDLDAAITNCLRSWSLFVEIIEAYRQQTTTTLDYGKLYGSERGLFAVSQTENRGMDLFDEIPANKFINLTYPWEEFTSLYVYTAVLVLAAFLMMFDLFYSVCFFGGIRLGWLKQHKSSAGHQMTQGSGSGSPGASPRSTDSHFLYPSPSPIYDAEGNPEFHAGNPKRGHGRSSQAQFQLQQPHPPPVREPLLVTMESNDYTAPQSVLRINLHDVRHGVRGLISCTGFLVVLQLAIALFFCFQAPAADKKLHQEVNYFQSAVVPVSDRSANSAVIEMSLAAWARAYLSLMDEHVDTAITLTQSWSYLQPTNWTGGTAARDPTRVQSPVIRDVRSAIRRLAAQTSLLREEPLLEAIYRDEKALFESFDSYLHFSGYETCLLAPNLVPWETAIQAYFVCVITAGQNWDCYNPPIAKLVELQEVCVQQGMGSADLGAYLRRGAMLQDRSFDVYNHDELGEVLASMTGTINTQVLDVIQEVEKDFTSMTTVGSLALPWAVLFFGWMAAPTLYMLFGYATMLFHAFYNS